MALVSLGRRVMRDARRTLTHQLKHKSRALTKAQARIVELTAVR